MEDMGKNRLQPLLVQGSESNRRDRHIDNNSNVIHARIEYVWYVTRILFWSMFGCKKYPSPGNPESWC